MSLFNTKLTRPEIKLDVIISSILLLPLQSKKSLRSEKLFMLASILYS